MGELQTVKWALFVKYLESKGCVLNRVKGDHFLFTKANLLRPIVIVKEKEIAMHIIKSNLKTLGIDTKTFLEEIKKLK